MFLEDRAEAQLQRSPKELPSSSLGSDTGGSIRQPASFCGVVGVTPTYGRVSRYGLTAFASSLDHIGPFARNVEDAATVLHAMAGRDELDSTSAFAPLDDYHALMKHPVAGLKLGLPKEYFEDLPAETGKLVHQAIEQLQRLGCEVPRNHLAAHEIRAIVLLHRRDRGSELESGALRWRPLHDSSGRAARSPSMYRNTRGCGFGAEVKRRIMLGTYVLSAGYYEAYYRKAQQVRTLVARDFSNAFQEVDAILAPVSPFPAFRIGEKLDDPLAMYLSDVYTLPGDLSGVPCMSVPCGESHDGLPIGLQIFANHFDESTMFRVAYNYERSTTR